MGATEGLSKSTVMVGTVVVLLIAVTSAASSAPQRWWPAGLDQAPQGGHGGGGRDRAADGSRRAVRRSAHGAGLSVSASTFQAARAQADALPAAAGTWSEVTNQPYNSDALGYRDPFWSNSSGGAGLVSGRMSAIVSDGNTVYAGAADGGVWKTTDKGALDADLRPAEPAVDRRSRSTPPTTRSGSVPARPTPPSRTTPVMASTARPMAAGNGSWWATG